MKKTITTMMLALGMLGVKAQNPQTVVADFESLTLAADTFYDPHSSTPFQTNNATFRYYWDTLFGGFWSAGFSYTNKNNVTNGTYTNDHAAITGKGYNNSNMYVTAWEGYDPGKMSVVLKTPKQFVNGFYVTNTTYSYKTMKNGGGPARAFGDTAHAHTTTITPGNYPDWFKLSVYGYEGGVKKTDSVEFYLADYRFSDNTKDYIVDTWKWVDCSKFGMLDSISFRTFSSDTGKFGINNPTYFAMDNFTTSDYIAYTGIASNEGIMHVEVGPNPFNSTLNVLNEEKGIVEISIRDIAGKSVYSSTFSERENNIDLSGLQNGFYVLQINSGEKTVIKKIIKN